MMNRIFLILTLIIFQACSSSKKKPTDNELDPSYEGITKKDFYREKPVAYNEEDDFHHFEDQEEDVLIPESLDRADTKKLEKVERKNDNITTLMGGCYQKKFGAAFSLADRLYEKYKKNPSYWNQVGSCYLIQGNHRKALLYFNQALSLDKKFSPSINNIGVIFLKTGYDQKALKKFEEASKLNPYSLTPIFNLAQLYLEYGLIEEAQKYFKALVSKGKRDSDVLNGLANTYLYQNNIKESLNVFEKIADYKLKTPDIGINYAIALDLAGDKRRAQRAILSIDIGGIGELEKHYNRTKRRIMK